MWVYGEEIYCGGDRHLISKRRTTYESLFVIRLFHSGFGHWYISDLGASRQCFAKEWSWMQIGVSILYGLRWD
uniref:Uncharacterized protein orf72 n=1 Tax=Bigelowiella natans TaxID=227086 RepID=E9NZV4_BIGNA|nr:hypothetical protein [Bigelowiella natans]